MILEKYQNHPSVLAIIQNPETTFTSFAFNEVRQSEVLDLLQSLDIKKSIGVDNIPPKLVKIAANEIAMHLTNAINTSIRSNSFPDKAKQAAVCPLDKGESIRTTEKNYRPVSILNTFSKIYEKIMKKQLYHHLENTLSVFIAAYRKSYSTQHVLIKLLEDWKEKLDKDHIVGAVLMDLSKAFDCIPHDILIAKLHAYGLDENSLVFIYSYLKRREQAVRINYTYSSFEIILSGIKKRQIVIDYQL